MTTHSMIQDVNGNVIANSVLEGYTTTATAAMTTTLTVASSYQQFFTGTTTQTVTMPVTSTLVLGQSFTIINNSSGVVTVQSSGANTIQAQAASTTGIYTCILTSGTTAASWSVTYINNNSGGSGTVNSGTAGQLAYYATTGSAVSGLTADPILQRVSTQTGTSATGTTVIPFDNTIPQNTEGDEYITLAITPKNAGNVLVIECEAFASNDAVGLHWLSMALFQDSTANALAASSFLQALGNQGMKNSIKYQMTAGTTSATTFKIRIGGDAAGTTTFNGVSGGQFLGGVMNSYIRITEYAS